VREGYQGFIRVSRMDYPGDLSSWSAVRQDSRSGRVWNLSQSANFGRDRLTFGVTQYLGTLELISVVQFADGAKPYSARLILRDKAKSHRAYLDPRQASGGKIALAGRVTPRSATLTFLANLEFAPDPLIRPAVKGSALAYRFPAAAAQRLAELDPREAVEVEFLFPSGETRTALIEVGDFAAGRAFLAAAQR
jgi:hypothetical protein